MINYFEFTYFLAALIVCAIAIAGAVCSIGWLLCEKELKKQQQIKNIFHARVRSQNLEIESLQAKNSFLLNRISEFEENGKEQSDV